MAGKTILTKNGEINDFAMIDAFKGWNKTLSNIEHQQEKEDIGEVENKLETQSVGEQFVEQAKKGTDKEMSKSQPLYDDARHEGWDKKDADKAYNSLTKLWDRKDNSPIWVNDDEEYYVGKNAPEGYKPIAEVYTDAEELSNAEKKAREQYKQELITTAEAEAFLNTDADRSKMVELFRQSPTHKVYRNELINLYHNRQNEIIQNSIQKEIEDIDKRIKEEDKKHPLQASQFSFVGAGKFGATPTIQFTEEQRNLNATADILKDIKKDVDARINKRGFFKGVGDELFTVDALDLGITSLLNNTQVATTLGQMEEKGFDNLREDEKVLLDALIAKEMVNLLPPSSLAYNVGKGVGFSIPFMIGYGLSKIPASALSKGAGKLISKYITKRVAEKGLGKAIAKASQAVATKAPRLTKFGNAVGQGTIQAGVQTAISPHTYSDMAERQIGEIETEQQITPEGVTAEFVGRNVDDKALSKAFLSSFITNAVEGMGGKALGEVGGYVFNKAMPGVKNLFPKLKKAFVTHGINQLAKSTDFNGMLNEFGEEYIDQTLNALFVGDQTLEDVYSGENAIETALTTAAISFGLGLLGGGVGYAAQTHAKKKYNDAVKRLDSAMPNLQAKQELVNQIVTQDRKERKILFANLQDEIIRLREEGKGQEAYALLEQAKALSKFASAYDNLSTFNEYLNDQVQEQMKTERDHIRQNANADMDNHTIIAQYEGENYLVVGGKVAFNQDGTIDLANSSESVTIKSPDDSKQIISPEKLSLVADMSFEELESQAQQMVWQRLEKEMEDAELEVNKEEQAPSAQGADGMLRIPITFEQAVELNSQGYKTEANGQEVSVVVAPQQEATVRQAIAELGGEEVNDNTQAPTEATTQGEQPTTQPNTETPTYPTDESGEPIFIQMPIEQTAQVIEEFAGEDAENFITNKVAEAKSRLNKANKAKPKSTKLIEIKAEREAINQEKQSAQAEYDYWTQVQQARSQSGVSNTEVNEIVNETSEQPNNANDLNDTTSSETNQPNGQEYKLSDEVSINLWKFVNFFNDKYGYNFVDEFAFYNWIRKKSKSARIKWLMDKLPKEVVREAENAILDFDKTFGNQSRNKPDATIGDQSVDVENGTLVSQQPVPNNKDTEPISNIQENKEEKTPEEEYLDLYLKETREASERAKSSNLSPKLYPRNLENAIEKGEAEAEAEYKKEWDKYLAKLIGRDIPIIDGTIESLKYTKGKDKNSARYKAHDYIIKSLQKRKRELTKTLTEEDKRAIEAVKNKGILPKGETPFRQGEQEQSSKAESQAKTPYILSEEYQKELTATAIRRRKELKEVSKVFAEELKNNPDVVIVQSLNDLPKEATSTMTAEELQNAIAAKGWFVAKNGKAYILFENAKDKEDLYATLFHEAVAHKGIKELLGEKNFNKLCQAVYDAMPEADRERIRAREEYARAKRDKNGNIIEMGSVSQALIADEYMAELAEEISKSKGKTTIAEDIVQAIRAFLRKIGIKLNINQNDVRHILHASYSKLQGKDADIINTALGKKIKQTAVREKIDDSVRNRLVYHGTGVGFEKFDHSFMGTGEGQQAFGWGTYVSDLQRVGESYAEATGGITDNVFIKGKQEPMLSNYISRYIYQGATKEQALEMAIGDLDIEAQYGNNKEEAQKALDIAKSITPEDITTESPRHLYTVDIPDDNGTNYLAWDKAVPSNVVNTVKERLFDEILKGDEEGLYEGVEKELKKELENTFKDLDIKGGKLYRTIEAYLGSDKNASLFLADLGYKGTSVPVGYYHSGTEHPEGARNFVIFNEDDAQIVEHARFRLGNRARAEYDNLLKKRRGDLNDFERGKVLDFFHSLDDSKENTKRIKVAVKWLADATIEIPRDFKQVVRAIMVCEIAGKDPMSYKSPTEVFEDNPNVILKEQPINPDEVPTLTNKREYPEGVTVYDVEDSEESRQNMRAIINTHFGLNSSPWCLLQGDKHGNLTEQSGNYWNRYDSIPKKVAFQNGKLLAFNAHDNQYDDDLWWDRQDEPSNNMPLSDGRYMMPDGEITDRIIIDGEGDIEYDEVFSSIGDNLSDWEFEIMLDYLYGEFIYMRRHRDHSLARIFNDIESNIYSDVEDLVNREIEEKVKERVNSEEYTERIKDKFIENKDDWDIEEEQDIDIYFEDNYQEIENEYGLDVESEIEEDVESERDEIYENVRDDNQEDIYRENLYYGWSNYNKVQVIGLYYWSVVDGTLRNPEVDIKSYFEENIPYRNYDGETIRFRFIGEQGAFNLDKAEEATIRLDNLNVARQMEEEGKDAKTIKLATGWERGADNKWRYEVEDTRTIDLNANVDYFKRNPIVAELYEKYISLRHKKHTLEFEGKQLSEEDELAYQNLAKEFQGTKLHNSRKLKDYIDDEELFKAYPQLRNIEVKFKEFSDNTKGYYSIVDNTIAIHSLMPKGKIISVLNHEIQHAIQHIEGFAKGGNTETANALRDKARAWSWRNALMETAKEYPELAGRKDLEQKLIEEYKNESLEEYIPSEEQRIKGFNLYVRGYDNEGYEEAYKQWSKVRDDNYSTYRNLSGEVESRNVQSRLGMTAEERRNSLASETEDVSRKDQIFIYDGLKSAMGSRVNARMAEIATHFKDKELSKKQQKVVDVFSGKDDNLTISVKTQDGNERKIVMRQGNEMGAGTKHSIYRHYGTNIGVINAEDITLIPDILANGKRTEKKRKNKIVIEYKYTDNNGVEYIVLTEVDSRRETFADFYTNRKTSLVARQTRSEEARDTTNDAFGDKDNDNIANKQEGVNFRLTEEADATLSSIEQRNAEAYNSIMNVELPKAETPMEIARNKQAERTLFRFDKDFASMQALQEAMRKTELWQYNQESKAGELNRGLYDSMVQLANLIKSIEKAYGIKIDDDSNAYWLENSSSSKAQERTEQLSQTLVRSLSLAMHEAEKKLGSQELLKHYALAKAGLERQAIKEAEARAIAQEKGEEYEDKDYAGLTGLIADLIGMTEKQYEELAKKPMQEVFAIAKLNGIELDKFIADCEAKLGNTANKLWSIVTELSDNQLKGQLEAGLISANTFNLLMYSGDANTLIEENVKNGLISKGQAKYIKTQGFTLEQLRDKGYITDEQYKNFVKGKKRYQYYLPLKGDSSLQAEDVIKYEHTRGKNQSKLKEAKGHRYKSTDPFVQLVSDCYGAIANEELNRWKRAIYEMCEKYPTDEFILDGQLMVQQLDGTLRPATDYEIQNGQFKVVKNRQKADIAQTPLQSKEHIMYVYINGEYRTIYFKNKQLAESINTQGGKFGKMQWLLEKTADFQRWWSKNLTTRNPAFIGANTARDFEEAMFVNFVNLGAKAIPVFAKAWNPASKLQRALHRHLTGKGGNTPEDKLVQEYFANGGVTAYNMIADNVKIKNDLQAMIDDANRGMLNPVKWWKATMSWLDRQSKHAELVSRIATYAMYRGTISDYNVGINESVAKSIWESKEVTVNFDKRGEWSKYTNLTSLFFNAGRQSNRMHYELFKRHPYRYLAAKTMMIAVKAMLPSLSAWLTSLFFDDEDYEKLIEKYNKINRYTRYNNLVLLLGDNVIAIPIAPSFSTTSMMAELARGLSDKNMEWDKWIPDAINAALSTYTTSAIGNIGSSLYEGDIQGAMLSAIPVAAIEPALQLMTNRDYQGRAIMKDGNWVEGLPNYMRAYGNTNPYLLEFSRWLNNALGGKDNIPGALNSLNNPAGIQHLFTSYGGGALTFYTDLASLAMMLTTREDATASDYLRQAPIINRFFKGNIDRYMEQDAMESYYTAKENLQILNNRRRELPEWERAEYDMVVKPLADRFKQYEEQANAAKTTRDTEIDNLGENKTFAKEKQIKDNYRKEFVSIMQDFDELEKEIDEATKKY